MTLYRKVHLKVLELFWTALPRGEVRNADPMRNYSVDFRSDDTYIVANKSRGPESERQRGIDPANGGVAQLGERLHGMQEVVSSNLITSTCG